MDLEDHKLAIRLLLRDHDIKFSRSFDEVFSSQETRVIPTPIQAPPANAYAERWVQTVRAECLDWTLVVGRQHLLRLLDAYVGHCNRQRPHRGLALAVPDERDQDSMRTQSRHVQRRDVLGGLIHEYRAAAA